MIRLKKLLAEIISNTDLGLDIHLLVENKDRLEGNLYQILVHLCKIYCVDDKELQKYWINKDIKKHLREILINKSYLPNKRGEESKYLKTLNKIDVAISEAESEYEIKINSVKWNEPSSETLENIKDKFKLVVNNLISPGKNLNFKGEILKKNSNLLQTLLLP